MYTIDGKEYGFYYDVEAYCKYSNYCASNPKASLIAAKIQQAVYMSESYARKMKAEGKDPGETLKAAAILTRPAYVVKELVEAVNTQEKEDSTRTVEAEEKNAKGGKR